MLAGVWAFSFGDALGKYIVATYPVGQLLFLRACASLLLLAPMIWRSRRAFIELERPGLHVLRVVLSTAEVAAFFVAVGYLPLADVITYYLACPIFVTALSAIVLREQVGWRRWTAVAVGFCGVLIAMRPSTQTISWPALIALGGSTSFAILMLITRQGIVIRQSVNGIRVIGRNTQGVRLINLDAGDVVMDVACMVSEDDIVEAVDAVEELEKVTP